MAMKRPGIYAPLSAYYFDDAAIMEAGEDAELLYVRMLAYAAHYNVNKPLPYPYHVDASTGEVIPGPQTNEEMWRLIGFQPDVDTQHVEVWRADWANEPATAVGMFPVFVDAEGGMFNLDVPITRVSDHRVTPTTKEN